MRSANRMKLRIPSTARSGLRRRGEQVLPLAALVRNVAGRTVGPVHDELLRQRVVDVLRLVNGDLAKTDVDEPLVQRSLSARRLR